MSGADGGPRKPVGEPDDAPSVPTQRRGSCPCGHPDVSTDHDRDCTARRTGSRLAEQLVVALRKGG